jgi:hypothetical protein
LRNIDIIRALAKAERNGWYIPAGWNRLTREQQEAWADDVLNNNGKKTNNQGG